MQPLPSNSNTLRNDGPPISTYAPRTLCSNTTIDLQLEALASALSSQNFTKENALLFIGHLEEQIESREPNELKDSMLILEPSQLLSDLVFSFAVCESRVYLTDKQLSATENRIACSGACALQMQLRLDELMKRITTIEHSDDLPVPLESQNPNCPHHQRTKSLSTLPCALKARFACSMFNEPKSKVKCVSTT